MPLHQPKYRKEEFARRGNKIYESQVRSQVEKGNLDRVVAIDIETGAFEIADTPIAATDLLYACYPDAQPWVIRIGHRSVYRYGFTGFLPLPISIYLSLFVLNLTGKHILLKVF